MGAKKKNDQKNPTEQNVSYFEIFRYATWLELTATIFGVIFGLLSGGGICYNMVQIGELSTAFVERTTNINRESSYLPLTQAFGGGRRLFNASYEENMAALLEDAKAIAAGMFLSIVISLIFIVLSVLLVSWSALRQITRIRMKFLNAVLRQDMSWFDTDSEFNLASKMTENLMSLKEGMGEKLSMVSNLVGTSIICICTSFPMGWELTLACLSIMPFSLAASIMLTNYQTKSSILEMKSYSQAGKQAEEVLKSIRTIVAFNGESKEVAKYSRLLQPAEKQGRKRGLYSGLGNGFNWILTYALNTIGLMYGTRLIVQGYDKAADDSSRYVVGVVFSILFNTYMATQSITFSVPHVEVFASARGAAASIFFLIDRQPKIDSLQGGGLCPRRVTGDICLEDIHFNYPSRTEVKILKGFSLRIKAGECVALVGSSGCGKSTILQLLQRLYDPQSGVIKLDEKDIKSLNIGWLRSCLGVVGQEPVLFHGTIFENIAIGVPDATLTAVQRVAEMAYAHDFITKLPHGYDTVIGERGASLSGGQKQRIAIARSLLREPAVLLLDEATSALDPNSERQVQIALDRASVGRTTISVSHRLSTIINADRIICMDQGAIVEEGTHKELMKKQGFYYKLVTTGKESKDVEEIETLSEGGDPEQNINDQISVSRTDLIRKSTKSMRQMHRQRQSIKRGSQDWMTPRDSFASVISAGLQNFAHNSEFKAADEQLKPLSNLEILKLNSPEWVLIVIGSIAAFVQGVCFPAFALIFGFSSGIFVLSDRDLIIYYADLYSGMFILVAAVAGISMCLQSVTFTTAGLKMTTRLRIKYFTALLAQEIGYFDRESNTVGAMCARLSGDAAEVQGATGLRIGLILQGISSVLVGFIMAMCYNWKLTLVGTVFLPLMVGSIWLEGIVSQQSQSDERAAMESATAIATEAVVSIRTVQSLGVETIFLKKFQEGLVEACSAIIKKARWRGLVLGSGVYVPFMAFGSATVYGTVLVSRGEMEYRIVLLVNMALMYGAYMLGQSLSYAPGVNSAKTAASRIVSVITRVPKVRTEDGVKDKLDWVASGSFSVNNVEFCYPTRPHQKILKGINLKVEVGMTVALVGSSGCGKSTVLQLMQRFYDPETGNIELDGRDIKTALTLPRLRRQLGVVQQEPVLFDGTLAENIAYGDNSRKVTMQEITAAAKAANIHSFIVSLPEGYNTNLGSSGAQLSGGQKQRVCIARALIRSPRLLLLDEATSALDANSERTVSEALEKAAKGRTCITIAHRLSTIKDADLICVVDKGKIVEQGTHMELIRQRGQYWRMCRGQNVT